MLIAIRYITDPDHSICKTEFDRSKDLVIGTILPLWTRKNVEDIFGFDCIWR